MESPQSNGRQNQIIKHIKRIMDNNYHTPYLAQAFSNVKNDGLNVMFVLKYNEII